MDADKCKGCINCMRKCPVQAIRVRNGKASIDYDKCISCGNCIRSCPNRAISARYDSYDILNGYRYRVALLPSCMYGQFPHIYDAKLILNSLKNIGFDHVFEVARASDILSLLKRELFIMKDYKEAPVISNVCPACVELICSRYHSLADNLLDFLPPLGVAAKLAREEAREKSGLPDGDIGVFYLSPCPAKVQQIKSGYYSNIKELSGVLSIGETCKKLNLVDVADVRTDDDIKASNMGIAWSTCGGEASNIPNTKQLAVDGIESVVGVLKELEDGKLKDIDFVEMRACQAGCVGGVLNITNTFVAKSKIHTLRKTVLLNKNNVTDKVDKPQEFYKNNWKWETKDVFKLDGNVLKAMEKMSKIETILKALPGLDCGVCGSPTCRTFAEDIVNGTAGDSKCVGRINESFRAGKNARLEGFLIGRGQRRRRSIHRRPFELGYGTRGGGRRVAHHYEQSQRERRSQTRGRCVRGALRGGCPRRGAAEKGGGGENLAARLG